MQNHTTYDANRHLLCGKNVERMWIEASQKIHPRFFYHNYVELIRIPKLLTLRKHLSSWCAYWTCLNPYLSKLREHFAAFAVTKIQILREHFCRKEMKYSEITWILNLREWCLLLKRLSNLLMMKSTPYASFYQRGDTMRQCTKSAPYSRFLSRKLQLCFTPKIRTLREQVSLWNRFASRWNPYFTRPFRCMRSH